MCKSILTVALIAAMCGASCSCVKNANPVSTEKISTQMVGDTWYAVFEFDCVENLNGTYIEYCDPDGFDLDNLAEWCGLDEWPCDYMKIDIDKSVVKKFKSDYAKWKSSDWETRFDLSESWSIKCIYTSDTVVFQMIDIPWEETINLK